MLGCVRACGSGGPGEPSHQGLPTAPRPQPAHPSSSSSRPRESGCPPLFLSPALLSSSAQPPPPLQAHPGHGQVVGVRGGVGLLLLAHALLHGRLGQVQELPAARQEDEARRAGKSGARVGDPQRGPCVLWRRRRGPGQRWAGAGEWCGGRGRGRRKRTAAATAVCAAWLRLSLSLSLVLALVLACGW